MLFNKDLTIKVHSAEVIKGNYYDWKLGYMQRSKSIKNIENWTEKKWTERGKQKEVML